MLAFASLIAQLPTDDCRFFIIPAVGADCRPAVGSTRVEHLDQTFPVTSRHTHQANVAFRGSYIVEYGYRASLL